MKISEWVAENIHRTRSQLRMDTFFCGGPGGQKQNKTETGVRITDLVTGLHCEGREHRTQSQNRKAAMSRLILKLVLHYQELDPTTKHTKNDGRVRTYNYIRGEVKCHITGNKYNLDDVIDGDLNKLIRDLLENDKGEPEC